MDNSSQKSVNEYIPKYIVEAPWYSKSDSSDYLSHQRKDPTKEVESYQEARVGRTIEDEFSSVKTSVQIKHKLHKLPKGACSNCGSVSHTRRDCMERPKRFGAISTGVTIQEDFQVKKVDDYDSKRDRWHGYDSADWTNNLESWSNKTKTDITDVSDDSDYELELNELGLQRSDIQTNLREDSQEKVLRDRNDMPAYLRQLNVFKSATSDPHEGFVNDQEDFVKHLMGDGAEYQKVRRLAWESNQNAPIHNGSLGSVDLSLNPEASPTAMALANRKLKEQEALEQENKKKELLDKYGGSSHIKANAPKQEEQSTKELDHPKEELSNRYVSKYVENTVWGNHASIWGSYWKNGKWGYACCKQTLKNAYCTQS